MYVLWKAGTARHGYHLQVPTEYSRLEFLVEGSVRASGLVQVVLVSAWPDWGLFIALVNHWNPWNYLPTDWGHGDLGASSYLLLLLSRIARPWDRPAIMGFCYSYSAAYLT
jgi:hypothetical protein